MSKIEDFKREMREGYAFDGPSFDFGAAIFEQKPVSEARVRIPLSTLNRHGIISGATGTGKTKTLQVIAEGLSDNGVPVLLMDLKGDLSGLARAGEENSRIAARHQKIGIAFQPKAYPVELFTLSAEKGSRLRATVSEFGPVLLSKMLELNDTQSGVISMVFKYCDDHSYPLLDLKDLKKILQFATQEGKKDFEKEYGLVSSATIGAIQRSLVTLEQQGAEDFFGEPSFEVDDLVRKDKDGNGMVSILRLTDMLDKPRLFSTFMLSLLSEIYATFPEQGDADKPKLAIFIDEAHLMFSQASNALLEQIETIIKLIRSKGVGIFFCTQLPTDIPDNILSQLGLRIQHAMRAITAKDRKSIKQIAENFPLSDFYATDRILTELGIGEALLTCLNERGIPTPLAATYLIAPKSRMNILSPTEIDDVVRRSEISQFYNKAVDRESAYELLNEKINLFAEQAHQEQLKKISPEKGNYSEKEEPSLIESISQNTMVRQMGRSLVRELTRSLFGTMGIKSNSRSKKSFW